MALILPSTKTKVKRNISDFTILLYGHPKVGKSTFASGFENSLFLATEAGLNSLEVYQIPIGSWEDFLEAAKLIATTKHEFKTIIIDTIDNLTKYCSDYICRKNGVQSEQDLPFGKGFSLVKGEFLRVLTKLSLLPYGLVMISHSKTEEIKTRTSVINMTVPTLSNTFRGIVLGMADIILFAHTIQQTKDETVEEIRVLRTKAAETYEAGDRTGRLPDTLPFNYQAFKDAWNRKVDQTKAGGIQDGHS